MKSYRWFPPHCGGMDRESSKEPPFGRHIAGFPNHAPERPCAPCCAFTPTAHATFAASVKKGMSLPPWRHSRHAPTHRPKWGGAFSKSVRCPLKKVTAGSLRIARGWIGNSEMRFPSVRALLNSRTIPSTGHTLPAAPPCQRLMPLSAQARKEAFASHHGGTAAMPPPTAPNGAVRSLSPPAAPCKRLPLVPTALRWQGVGIPQRASLWSAHCGMPNPCPREAMHSLLRLHAYGSCHFCRKRQKRHEPPTMAAQPPCPHPPPLMGRCVLF